MKTTSNLPRAKPYRLSEAEVKALVRYRDGYRCTECGMTSKDHHRAYRCALDVHRLVPGSRYTVKGCVTLCRCCHGPHLKSISSRRRKGPTKPLGVQIPAKLRDKVDRALIRERRELNTFVAIALEKYLDELGCDDPPSSGR